MQLTYEARTYSHTLDAMHVMAKPSRIEHTSLTETSKLTKPEQNSPGGGQYVRE